MHFSMKVSTYHTMKMDAFESVGAQSQGKRWLNAGEEPVCWGMDKPFGAGRLEE